MGNYVHRTTKQYLQSVSPNSLLEPLANYIEEPDLSGVVGVPTIYWNIIGDVITEMSQGEKDAVDAQILSNARDGSIQVEIDNIESVLRQIVIETVSQLNVLRAIHGLPDITFAQVKTTLRNGLGS